MRRRQLPVQQQLGRRELQRVRVGLLRGFVYSLPKLWRTWDLPRRPGRQRNLQLRGTLLRRGLQHAQPVQRRDVRRAQQLRRRELCVQQQLGRRELQRLRVGLLRGCMRSVLLWTTRDLFGRPFRRR